MNHIAINKILGTDTYINDITIRILISINISIIF